MSTAQVLFAQQLVLASAITWAQKALYHPPNPHPQFPSVI